ncbi:hypothetical protein ACFSL6_04160 [Paenibacillus thailandensis]|uniref:hypothetical protein n=1 Tax=Paenibacillus thailandensis TaxID=393250 RepID=UPI00363A7641
MKRKRLIMLDLSRESKRIRQLLATGRMFVTISLCSMIFFVVIGAASIVQREASAEPVSGMKGFAASVSGGFFWTDAGNGASFL